MKRVDLVFEEYPDTPVSVVVSPVPMRAYFDLSESYFRASMPMDEFRACLDTFERLAQPEPSLDELDFNLARAAITQWIAAVREVPLPLPVAPSERRPSQEPSSGTRAARRTNRRRS